MTPQRLLPRTVAAVFVIFVLPGVIWAQESIQAAQTLYASASYDEALALLDRLQEQQLPPGDIRSVQQSRALCLLALGRSQDAEVAIAAVVNTDPLYRPDDSIGLAARADGVPRRAHAAAARPHQGPLHHGARAV